MVQSEQSMGIWQVWDLRGYLLLSISHKIGNWPLSWHPKLQSIQQITFPGSHYRPKTKQIEKRCRTQLVLSKDRLRERLF